MLEWTQIDQSTLVVAGTAVGTIAGAMYLGWKGIVKGKKNAPETPLPAAPQSLDLARMEAFQLREFTSLRHEMERIENRQATSTGKALDLLARIDETNRLCLSMLREITK